MILTILYKIAVIFIMIGIGYLSAKSGLIKDEYILSYNKLLINVAAPVMLLFSMQGKTFDMNNAYDTIWCLASYFIAVVVILGAAYYLCGFLGFKSPEKGFGSGVMAFSNIGYMGFPIALAVFGETVGMNVVIMNITFSLLIFTIGPVVMFHEEGQPLISLSVLKKLLNPALIGCVLGFILYIFNIQLPTIVGDGLSPIGNMMTPLSMLIVGMQLSECDLLSLIRRRNLLFCLGRLLLAPAISLIIAAILPLSRDVAIALVYANAMPAAAMTAILAQDYGHDSRPASECIALSSFFSLATLPFWSILLSYIYL